MQVPTQQSLLVPHAEGGYTHAQTGADGLVLSSQKWLEQSPPTLHGLPTGCGVLWQTPPVQTPEQQSAVVTHADGGNTHAQTGAEGFVTSSQNLLQQSPPPVHDAPTGEHGLVVLVVPLTHVWETLDEGGAHPG